MGKKLTLQRPFTGEKKLNFIPMLRFCHSVY